MERINPYAVMRDTKTLEAYRAYSRAVAAAGQPFLAMAFMLLVFFPVWVALSGGTALHRSPGLVLGTYVVPAILAGLLLVIGAMRMARYRREHPIPDEWRQIRRFTWPSVAGRKAPLS